MKVAHTIKAIEGLQEMKHAKQGRKRKHEIPQPKVINIADYCRNKDIVESTPYVFSKGVGNYLTKSGLVPEKEFEEKYSVNLIPFNYKGENPDKTKV